MTKRIPALLARTQFGQIFDRVTRNRERFLVTKKGEAKVVIMSIEDYLRSIVKTPPSMAALQEQAKRSGADKFTFEEIQAEIDASRNEKTPNPS